MFGNSPPRNVFYGIVDIVSYLHQGEEGIEKALKEAELCKITEYYQFRGMFRDAGLSEVDWGVREEFFRRLALANAA